MSTKDIEDALSKADTAKRRKDSVRSVLIVAGMLVFVIIACVVYYRLC